jgi:hypothetical protein
VAIGMMELEDTVRRFDGEDSASQRCAAAFLSQVYSLEACQT